MGPGLHLRSDARHHGLGAAFLVILQHRAPFPLIPRPPHSVDFIPFALGSAFRLTLTGTTRLRRIFIDAGMIHTRMIHE